MSREDFICEQARICEIALTLEADAVASDDLWWAGHFASRAAEASAAAFAASTGSRHG